MKSQSLYKQIKIYANKEQNMKKLILLLLITLNVYAAPRVGDSAVEFKLQNLYNQSNMVSSSNYNGKITLLNLWASWCSGCQEEMPLFVALQNKYAKSNFEIITSSIDSSPQSAKDFLNEVDAQKSLTALYDEDKTLPKAYKCPGMPTSFLIGKDGKIVKVYVGSLDKQEINELKQTIQELVGK